MKNIINLTKKETFENGLYGLLKNLKTDSEDFITLRNALDRLENNPKIFTGDPNGIFTYDDPILANAVFVFYQYEKGNFPHLIASPNNIEIQDRLDERLIGNFKNWIDWVPIAVKLFRYQGNRTFELLKRKTPEDSIKSNKSVMRLALIGDAGFRGVVQKNILNKIKEKHEETPFDFLIHLGDTYFGGSDEEMKDNFLDPFKKVGPKVLSLIGNHDLYYGGVAFLDVIEKLDQPGRFFSIENNDWCIACLDTALPSKAISRNEGELDDEQIIWLENLIKNNNQKRIILLSHHYIHSGWTDGSPILREQLQPHLPKIFSWYWGHEHNCATYDKETVGYHGACIGNGVFMEKWSIPKKKFKPTWFPGGFCKCSKNKFSSVWQHGFLELEISSDRLIEIFHIESGKFIRELKTH